MENVFYKSYKELVSEYFGIDYKVGENAPKLSKQLSKKGIEYTQEELQAFSDNQDRYINLDDEDFTFCENIEDFEELYYVNTCDHCGCAFSVNGDYAEVQGNYFCSDDCGDSFYHDDMEEGSDGCLYCSDCIHDHLEDEEEIA